MGAVPVSRSRNQGVSDNNVENANMRLVACTELSSKPELPSALRSLGARFGSLFRNFTVSDHFHCSHSVVLSSSRQRISVLKLWNSQTAGRHNIHSDGSIQFSLFCVSMVVSGPIGTFGSIHEAQQTSEWSAEAGLCNVNEPCWTKWILAHWWTDSFTC